MNENVGSIEYDARINTSRLKGDARETDAIVSKTGDNVERTGKDSFSEFGQWAKVGLAAAGVATAALGLSAFKTGIEYNTLQQTSRAALKTILGGAEAANAQMDKLDAFARNSPFAKDVFIRAQQQLLGFGVEASKVIPTLDAIQQSVAAVGGSSADIESITAVLAKIQAQGRLSGEELLQLGGYGIDAATVIGKGMGKTGQEIRDMASKPGGIPVDQIWDPLVNGLDDKFGGAADNVKKTWSGTVDRITAAFRDVGAAIAAPFVDPNGGGKAIEWGNTFADTLREIEKGVKPTVEVIKGFIGQIITALKPVTDFIANNKQAWELLKVLLITIAAVIGGLIIAAGVALVLAFAALQAIINAVIFVIEKFIKFNMWLRESIATVISGIIQFGVTVKDVFTASWNIIVNTFSNVGNWIGDKFRDAVSAIKAAFGGLGSFFVGIWNNIINTFSSVGTTVGNVIGSAFRNVINSVLRGASSLLNGFINAINVAVDVINNIPGVNISRLGALPVPQLATGGIVTSPTLAMIGEGRESEAVIPLSKLDEMMNNSGSSNTAGNVNIELNMSGIMTRSRSDTRAVAADLIESINEQMRARQLPEIGQGYLRKGTI